MAVYYLRSTDGSDASDGLSWTNAKATLVGALAVATSADSIQVSQVHAETQAGAMALAFPGEAGLRILCVDDGAEPSVTLATTATVTTTGNNAITAAGYAYIYGIAFNSGTGNSGASDPAFASSTAGHHIVLDTCSINSLSTNAAAHILFGSVGSSASAETAVELVNSSLRFGATGQSIFTRHGSFRFAGLTIDAAGSAPDTLFTGTGGAKATVLVESSDISSESFTNLVSVSALVPNDYTFRNLKLPSGIVVATGTFASPRGTIVRLHNCDSGDTNYRMAVHTYEGSVVQETTIVKTSGASDGVTPISWKMVSSTGTKFFLPLASPEIVRWNDTTGSAKTVTVEFVHDSVTALQNDEIWLEVDYLGTSGFPQGTRITDRMANILSTPADQADSSVSWTTTGLTNPNTRKLDVTFTPQEKGYIHARVMVANPSQTVYIDPVLTVT